ncbi:MAG: hypothetical protein UHY90_04555 [Treponema sp.]|nr:hypothetical protein [Spirochaetia bacterium]MDD7458309.1 hypothetical protein [Spirochaetales bacterium]MDY5811385.1 hypothetical protein [Treponema sp.]MEE1181504.1 hypothetical protein [Treponema sp.]
MKKNLILFLVLSLGVALNAGANEFTKFYSIQGAFYPESKPVSSDSGKVHFAPVTGPYHSIEAMVSLGVEYKIPAPLGTSAMLKDSFVSISPVINISPVHAETALGISFLPLPFLKIGGISSIGSGWNMGEIYGLREYDDSASGGSVYKNATFGKRWIYNAGAYACFMFDAGYVFPGEWTHVVFLANYKVFYEGMTGMGKGEPWVYKTEFSKVNGLQEEMNFLLGYQMPLKLKMIGINYNYSGHIYGSDYGDFDSNYNGEFRTMFISPMAQIDVGQKNELYILARFKSIRSFKESHKADEPEKEILLTQSGREWLFSSLAVSFTHYF